MTENFSKDLNESVYHGAVVSALAIGYTMLGNVNKNESSMSWKFRRRRWCKVSYNCSNIRFY